MIGVKDCIGKKVLVKEKMSYCGYNEMDILGLSPNGQYVKARLYSGREEWLSLIDFGEGFGKHEIVDILEENIFEERR